jgi:hypothetical protein
MCLADYKVYEDHEAMIWLYWITVIYIYIWILWNYRL